MDAIDYQPRISRWGHVWRYSMVLLISGVAWFELSQWQWENNRLWFWSDLAIGLLALLSLTQRRRHPVAVALFANAVSCVSATSGGPATLALVSLATRRRWREMIPVALVGLTGGLTLELINPPGAEPLAVTIPSVLFVIAATVGWGLYIGSRRELLFAFRRRAETAESEQEARVSQARSAERSRIAREMHDVLAHRISLVTMHSGALTYREDLSADEMRATAAIIQDSSHQALIELREVLGILREEPGDSAPERPQPSAVDLPDLIDEARRSGMRIQPGRVVETASMPDSLGRTVYRIVQEGLTNARKHAPDTSVVVHLDGGPDDGVTVEVRNLLRIGSVGRRPPESGLGLVGLAERTALAGGRLTHEVSPSHEFVLRAWLPWPA